VRGWRRARRLRSTHLQRGRLAAFVGGLALLWIAVASPLDAFAGLLLSAHMVQHLLLMVAAPALVLVGAPIVPLLLGLPRWAARDALGPFLAFAPLRRFGHALTHPVIGWLALSLAMIGWHLPGPYQLALRSTSWHEVEHLCFFTGGLLFWWPVVQPWPTRAHWPAWSLPPYLLLGDLVNTGLAALLAFSDRVLYPAYETAPRLFGLSASADQVLAAALMWVPGSLAFLVPAMVITWRLLSPRAAAPSVPASRSDGEPTRAARPFDLLRLPLVGPLLRARHGRRALQAVMLLLAAAVVADGLRGNPMSAMNLAGVLPWTYGRGFAVVALLVAGNVFCMACPFMLPRELGKRLGLATRHWPRAFRSKWLAAFLLAAFFWAYEAFSLWDSAYATAGILVGYFAAAFLVDTFFRGASFCKYVCPIGQFQFVGSLVSPLEVTVRKADVCAGCTTHDCLRGNAAQRGCETGLYLPRKAGNLNCTLCLDCVKACPHDNVGITIGAPGRDLVGDPMRSSLGRLSRRPDVAALALVFVVAAFTSAAAMVTPIGPGLAVPVAALVFVPWAGTMAWAARGRARLRASGQVWCRLALALVPLGLSMWSAHVLFHLLTGWSSLWPVAQRAATDLGLHALGEASWSMVAPLVSADGMLRLQILLLDLGLLVSLYVGWRIVRGAGAGLRLTRGPLVPWVTVAVSLYAVGVWTFLQPMAMRGMVH